MWIVLSEIINILRNLHKKNLGCPRKFCNRFMYIASSSGNSLLNLNLPFKVILMRFEVVF